MEIIRNEELHQMINMIQKNPYGKFLISGDAGSGKTFLLNTLGKLLQESGKAVKCRALRFSQTKRNIYYEKESENIVYLFDGLDEVYKHKAFIEEIRNSANCFVCTARENIFDIKFDYELKLRPLTNEQALLLVNDYLGNSFSELNLVEDIFNSISKENITPRILIEKLHSKLKGKGIDEYFSNIKSDVHQLYTYGEGISLQHPKIIVPERKIIKVPSEIKNDINVITRSLLEKVASKPEILYEITPRQFEELVCELFERKGYNVRLTRQTRDGGKDLIILSNSILGELMIYAECKRYSQKHPVNVGLVRELYGTIEADKATAGIMVTTSYFSKDARKFQGKISGRMNFIDYSELIRQILECS